MLEITRSSRTYVTVRGGLHLKDWREQYRVKVPGHQFTRLFKQKRWDGTWAPGDWLRADGDDGVMFRCTRGLLARIVTELNETLVTTADDDTVGLRDLGERAESFLASHPFTATLRDYQRAAFTRVITQGWGRIAFATNAGKGAVIALLAQYAASYDQRALICCDEIAVFDALYSEITKWTRSAPGVVNAGVREVPTDPITLAMVPTLAQRLKSDDGDEWLAWLASHEMLLLDEADRALAPTWQTITTNAVGTLWRAGFSGSFPVDVYDDMRLEEIMGPVLERVKNAALIERGISARPTIELYPYPVHDTLERIPATSWHPDRAPGSVALPLSAPARRMLAYDYAVAINVERHQFIMSLITPDTPTVVIVNRIEHGRHFVLHCEEAVFLSGDADENERRRVLDAFGAGKIRVLVTTKILDRGTNRLGQAATLILASGEGSTAQILQRIGRGLRRGENEKEWLRVVDILDTAAAADGRDAKKAAVFFDRAARKRLAVYEDEGFDVQIMRAPR